MKKRHLQKIMKIEQKSTSQQNPHTNIHDIKHMTTKPIAKVIQNNQPAE